MTNALDWMLGTTRSIGAALLGFGAVSWLFGVPHALIIEGIGLGVYLASILGQAAFLPPPGR